MPAFVSRNGVLIPPAEASISVFNPAIYGSYGVYESIQVVNGVVFERDAHIARLRHSAEVIELPLPAAPDVIARWIDEALAASNEPSHPVACTVRLFVVGPENGGEACAYIWTQPRAVYPPAHYDQGVRTITFEGMRFLPQSKSLNTLASFMAQRRARAAGAHEAFLVHAGLLTEGSNSNLFAVIGGVLVTPPEDEVLSGVTRELVLRLAREHGIPHRADLLPVDEVGTWQECFITSTSRHVMPVSVIDDRSIGNGAPGPMTRRLHTLFEDYFQQHTRQASDH